MTSVAGSEIVQPMTPTTYPSGTVTFLFTDIEGSTKLWEAHPEEMRVALASHDAILRAAIERAGGVTFKTVGDAFCAAFVRPQDALVAAVDAQRALAKHAWPQPIDSIRVRMGIHTGTATETEGDYFGPTVNRVARFMSIGYGEQILVSSTAAALLRDALPAGTTLRNLGTHRLKDLSQPEITYQVVAEELPSDFPTLRSIDSRPNNLPFQLSGFVGRERELRELRDLLSRHRLVSIVGLGGIGKTRLALQVAGELIDSFADGAWFVQLSSLRAATLIPQVAADVLRIREIPTEPLEDTIVKALADREVLIVIDSAEHLLSATAAFVKRVSSSCGFVRFLVTSREPLHLTGERVVRLESLQGASALFVDRAQEVAPGLALDEAAMEAIEAICRRLDGIPLAIELAAARVATMSISDLSARLGKRLPLLTSRDSTKEERHRTLRDTIAWSQALLGATEAAVFRTLGVFNGTFGPAAVAAVADGADEVELFDVIDALVAKSLVSVDPSSATTRYVVLDTVREYLVDAASADGSIEHWRARHFGYYAALVASLTADGPAKDVASYLGTIGVEISNLRAALEWCVRERPADAAPLATSLSRYWKIRGHITEGRAWFRHILDTSEIGEQARAALLRRAATFATEQDDYDEARSLATESRTLYERLSDREGIAEALHTLAVIEQRCGRVEVAADHYHSAIANFRAVGYHYGEAMSLMNVALLAFEHDDLAEAARRIDEAAAAAAQTGNADLRGHVTAFRGSLAFRKGDLESAERFYREALGIKVALGNRTDTADISTSLAAVYARQGRLKDARALAGESLRIGLELEAGSLVIYGFEAFSEIAVLCGEFDEAALYFSLAREMRQSRSYWFPGHRRMNEIEQTLRRELGDRFSAISAGAAGAEWRKIAESLASAAT